MTRSHVLVALCYACFASSVALANDAMFAPCSGALYSSSTGKCVPVESSDIALVDEKLSFDVSSNGEGLSVVATYTLVNSGPPASITIGFPV